MSGSSHRDGGGMWTDFGNTGSRRVENNHPPQSKRSFIFLLLSTMSQAIIAEY